MCRLVQVGYFLLFVCLVACSLSFSAPFWLNRGGTVAGVGGIWTDTVNVIPGVSAFGPVRTEGLLAKCNKDMKCQWFWENDFEWEKTLTPWQKATQGLFAAGVLLLLIGWFISTFHVCCCRCCKESYSVSSALGSLALSGTVLIVAAVIVYGVYANKEFTAEVDSSKSTVYYYWAFWVAVGGAVAGVVANILFFCEGCRSRSHSGYHMTRVV